MARILGVVSPDAPRLLHSMRRSVERGYARPSECVQTLSPVPQVRLAAVGRESGRCAAQIGDLSIVIDGNVYNRSGLGAYASDPELIAALYRSLGFEGLLRQLNGDFSLALHDCTAATLWLARDRLGVKPLYYAEPPDGFAFSSRPAPLLEAKPGGPVVNRRFAAVFAASHYRYFDNAPHESPYQGIAQLPAAHWLRWRDGKCQTGSYWRLDDAPDLLLPEAQLAEQYRELLLSAVGLRVAATQRPAFTLSGGMDSSSVLASARHLSAAAQPAFSTVYSDKTFDESAEIKPMLDHAVSQWHSVPVDNPDVFALVRRMVAANDEPVATATWLSHFLLCEQAAAGGYDALFGGLGGDELNAGEYEYFFFHFADLQRAGRSGDLALEIERWAAHHDHPIYRKNAGVAAATMARCTDPQQPGRCLPDLARMRRYFAVLNRDFYDIERFEPVMEAPFGSYLKTRSYQDLTRETAPCCLRAEDRQTQAFGLDNHVPFFDHRLVEFMFRIPGSLKIRQGVTKILLREAMRGILPEETRTRIKKTGWNAPAHLWFSGSGKQQLQDLIRTQAFRERGIYDCAAVMRIVDQHQELVDGRAQQENHMMFLWQLVNLESWMQSLSK